MVSNIDYNAFLAANNIKALLPADVGKDYEECAREWYHLMFNEEDFGLLVAVPNIRWYSICRCHLVADDASTAHEHMHALIHFVNGSTHLGFKKKLQRAGKRVSPKTTFKKIICLDHAVGVLRYICCKDGQKPSRRDGDGLVGTPHVHYSRRVYNNNWLHGRGGQCPKIRDGISECVALGVKDVGIYTAVTELHQKEKCLCDRGDAGIKKRLEANRQRREFYKTEKGISIRKMYKEKQLKKQNLIREIAEIGLNKKAELYREKIITLLELL